MSIDAGLQKMFEAKADVNKMKAELAVKNQELAVAAKEAEALLKQVGPKGMRAACCFIIVKWPAEQVLCGGCARTQPGARRPVPRAGACPGT